MAEEMRTSGSAMNGSSVRVAAIEAALKERCESHDHRLEVLEDRVFKMSERLSALEARVAYYAGLGAILGGAGVKALEVLLTRIVV